jgi:AraC family transcriptional regulator, regulatory protein of adaptative response / methylated-DNA-[protein]-cysteine methyltransferase
MRRTKMQTLNNVNQKWMMVMARDAKADDVFVYAVKSTGVFCRPSCPSRRPRREVVEFFDSPTQARDAGYRDCRRCKPGTRSEQLAKVEDACRFIERNLDTPLSLGAVARHAGSSAFHFQRTFKSVLGVSPRQYQQARRAEKFKSALHNTPRITDAIYEAGYGSSSRAYEGIPAQMGMTPSAFRRNGEGTEIRYTILTMELGKLLVATTARGLCSVRFGENETALVRDLRHEFRAAGIRRDDEALRPLLAQIEDLRRGARHSPQIPLDIRGTAFQQLVWNALRQIPRGKTRSYSAVAKAIGKPKAVRAVANACAANPVAVVIPCHRVVEQGGGLGGYRWGVKRKAALLEDEKSQARTG